MRILQILNRVPWPLKDGGSIGYYNFIKGYHDAGCEVTVAALNTSRHYVEKIPDELNRIATWHTVNIDNRIKLLPALLNLFGSTSYHVDRFISASFENMLKDLLSRQEFDVIIFESLFTMPYFDVVQSNSKALLVLRQHNVEYHIWQTLSSGQRNPMKKWYLKLLAKRLKKYEQQQVGKPDIMTTVTEADAEMFRTLGYKQPMRSVPLGIDIDPVLDGKAHAATEIPSVFHIGSMEWQPNVEAVLWFIEEVWSKVAAGHRDLHFYIAGRGMTEPFKRIKAHNMHIIGEVEDAMEFIQQKQIMIVPLFSGSGIRVKILEAMALGKTIIATTLGAQGIECVNGKHLIIADNSQEFIKAIEMLVTNPQLAAELGNHAKQLISQKYDNTKVIADVLAFYHTHIERKKT